LAAVWAITYLLMAGTQEKLITHTQEYELAYARIYPGYVIHYTEWPQKTGTLFCTP